MYSRNRREGGSSRAFLAQSRQSIRRISIKGTGSSLGEGTARLCGESGPVTLNRTCLSRCAGAFVRRVRSSFIAGNPSPHRLAWKVAFHFHVPFPVPSSACLRRPTQYTFTIRANVRSARKRILCGRPRERNWEYMLSLKKTSEKNAHASRKRSRTKAIDVNAQSSMQAWSKALSCSLWGHPWNSGLNCLVSWSSSSSAQLAGKSKLLDNSKLFIGYFINVFTSERT